MNYRHFFAGTALAVAVAHSPAYAAEAIWSVAGFNQPESVQHDPQTKEVYVSSINGSPVEATGKGYISRLSETGKVLDHKWVKGLDSPKGMAVANGHVYVADLHFLRVIDQKTGELLHSAPAANSKMLNDVTVDDEGVVYVSDWLGGAIYRYAGKGITRWFETKDIPHPNGLQFKNGTLLIGNWGDKLNKDFSTNKLGSLYRLDPKTMQLTQDPKAVQLANIDGVSVLDNGTVILNDWLTGNVFEVSDKGPRLLFNAGKGAADTSVSGGKLYVPMMLDNRLDVYSLEAITKPAK